MNPKKLIARNIIIKLSKVKDKDRILKAAREKQLVTCKGNLCKTTGRFFSETLQAGRQ